VNYGRRIRYPRSTTLLGVARLIYGAHCTRVATHVHFASCGPLSPCFTSQYKRLQNLVLGNVCAKVTAQQTRQHVIDIVMGILEMWH
jgi:hypothetical protein